MLVAYVLGLLPFTALYIVQRCFYALADTRTPFRFTIAQLAVVVPGILLCVLLPPGGSRPASPPSSPSAARCSSWSPAVLLRAGIGPLLDPHPARSLRALDRRGARARRRRSLVLARDRGVRGRLDGREPLGRRARRGASSAPSSRVVYLAVMAALRAPELGIATGLVGRGSAVRPTRRGIAPPRRLE